MDALILLVLLFTLGIVGGRLTAKRHARELDAREAELRDMFVTSLKSLPGACPDGGAALVTGEVTIASDYLKTFLSGLRTLVGGEMKSFLNLTERAHREARLRMMEAARAAGFDAVGNVRVTTANIGGAALTGNQKGLPMATVLTSGTAYRRASAA